MKRLVFGVCLLLATAATACGDDARHQSHETCFLPDDLDPRSVEACPDAWSDQTVERVEGELDEEQVLQNIHGPLPRVVDHEGAPWLMSCCYDVYTASDTSWPLI